MIKYSASHWRRYLALSVVISSVPFAQELYATPLATQSAKPYQPVPPVAADQAQVVYYRSAQGTQRQGGAHVYIDREFHTSLLSGGYSAFCVVPGTHVLGAYLGDEPLYPGKSRDLFQATLQGGETYFLQVREDGTTLPLAVERDQAEAYLKAAHAQRHVLSRASTVEACRHYGFLETQKVADRDYSFTTERLFVGGKLVMSASGKQALKQFIEDLQKDGVPLREVHIEGHTDPLGDEAENQLLGLRRANAVREALIAQGVPQALISASSSGHRDPVVDVCYGRRAEQRACYAPNNRVVLKVRTQKDSRLP
ncbi:OmpA family protein [Pseudomonas chlororaphis]|uniref:OmpA family protein n=1 Tax=Pseudomonas chlororaphis TaxID=587753 RepID=UPI00131FCAC5|nr:OmpA family protein [Pseudomonas chlororaphis]QHC89751.1 hypothetical protein PchlR47_16005 [Pseudomonas chlororaphis]